MSIIKKTIALLCFVGVASPMVAQGAIEFKGLSAKYFFESLEDRETGVEAIDTKTPVRQPVRIMTFYDFMACQYTDGWFRQIYRCVLPDLNNNDIAAIRFMSIPGISDWMDFLFIFNMAFDHVNNRRHLIIHGPSAARLYRALEEQMKDDPYFESWSGVTQTEGRPFEAIETDEIGCQKTKQKKGPGYDFKCVFFYVTMRDANVPSIVPPILIGQ